MPATSRYYLPWQYHVLDINQLRREGAMKPGSILTIRKTWGGQDCGTMVIRASPEWIGVSVHHGPEKVRVTYSDQKLGGQRAWMRCPSCAKRVGKLYGSLFRCRTCARVTYPSQRTDAAGRAQRRAEILRRRLGDDGCIFDDAPEKPKGMWWRTFERKLADFEEAEEIADEHLAASLMRTFRRICR